jgi:hypothetical protein
VPTYTAFLSSFTRMNNTSFHCYCCSSASPFRCLRAQVLERVGLRNHAVLELSLSLPARVKAGNHFFREYPLAARLLALSSSSWWCGDHLLPGVSGDQHCFLSAMHRAGRLHQEALCRLVYPALPLVIFLTCVGSNS